jgi:hypothetical protein
MKEIFILLTSLWGIFTTARAQTAEDSAKAVVHKLFEGMKKADGEMVKSAFADSAILQTIVRNREGQIIVRSEQVQRFAEIVGSQQGGDLDERIQFDVVKVDGPLASVWTPYKFYFKGQFSHCGVNSFQLVRVNGEWKIQYLIDTRRRNDCGE